MSFQLPTSVGGALNAGTGALSALAGLQSGKPAGYVQAANGLKNLYTGLTGNNSLGSLNGAATGLNNVAGIYSGIEQGGVGGYGRAAANAAQLGGNLLGNQALSTIGGDIAAPLALYNAVNNWQSGATGNDALGGLGAGMSIGSIIPGVGTLLGGALGAGVGALSSAFGPGAKDPETKGWDSYLNASKQDPNISSQVQNPYLMLAGVMDEHNSTLPMYQQYGRMGEQKFTNDMVNQINSAVSSGKVKAGASADDIYNQVVAPWVSSMGSGWKNVGSDYTNATQGLLKQMVGQYVNGTASQDWKAIGGDSPFANLSPYAGGQSSGAGSPLQQLTATRSLPSSQTLNPNNASLDYYHYGEGPEQSFFQTQPKSSPPAPTQTPQPVMARGGALQMVSQPQGYHSRAQHYVGNLTGTSGRADDIDAKLANNEYVMDAETVAMLGDGSPDAGAKKLDEMRIRLRQHKGKALANGKFSPDAKDPQQYLKAG